MYSRLRPFLIGAALLYSVVFLVNATVSFVSITQKRTAALKGIRWLLDHKNQIPAEDAIVYYGELYKVVDNEALAGELLSAARLKEKEIKKENIIFDEKTLRPDWDEVILPLVEDLFRRKCGGENITSEIDRLKSYIIPHWNEIFHAELRPSAKLIASYLLGELGIPTEEFYTALVQSLRNSIPTDTTHVSFYESTNLYALTHIVFIESGYFSKKVNPKDFSKETALFEAILESITPQTNLTDRDRDIISEIVISLKLLGYVKIPNESVITTHLIKAQNKDGSWGGVHNTTMAAAALVSFTTSPRKANLHCY